MDNIILKNEYESYVSKQPGVSFMQSEKWSRVKTDWLSEQILLKDECGYVQGAVQMLIKKIPFLHTSFIYVPRGPVCDMHDKYAVKRLTELIRLYAQKYNACCQPICRLCLQTKEKMLPFITNTCAR